MLVLIKSTFEILIYSICALFSVNESSSDLDENDFDYNDNDSDNEIDNCKQFKN